MTAADNDRRYAVAATDPVQRAVQDLEAAGLEIRSWKVGVDVGEPHYSYNGVRFATPAEATAAGNDLLGRWFVARDFKVFPSADAPNYAIVDGALKSL